MQQPLSAPRIIERPHLRNMLLDALAESHVFLTAPAGYGKSMVLRDLERQPINAHLVTISRVDLDLSVLKARLTPLLTAPGTILLDDVHLLAGGVESCYWLQRQLNERRQRWLLAGRHMPFAPDVLLLSGQAVGFGKETLAFSLAETAVLLSQSEAAVTDWHTRLAGWSLAISLLARLPSGADPLADTEAHLFTYLTQVVFAQLSATFRQFLQVIAVPLQFNQALVAHLWHDEAEATAFLEMIDRADLYVQPADERGWYRFHDLIRDYLLQDFAGQADVAAAAVAWFQSHGMVSTAVDQAFDAGLTALAAQQISLIPLSYFHENGSYLTYRRWIRALEKADLTLDPMLVMRLANVLQLLPGYQQEAYDYTDRALVLAIEQGNAGVRFLAQTNRALWHYRRGELMDARQLILPVLVDPACQDYPRLFALRIATLILSDAGYYDEVGPYFKAAIDLAYEMNTQNEPFMNLANMAAMYLLPLGRTEAAEEGLERVLAHFATAPGWLSQYLTYWCELQVTKADWAGLTEGLERLDETLLQMRERNENLSTHIQIWQTHYQTIQAILRDADTTVQNKLVTYDSLLEHSPLNQDCVGWLACWHLRRRRAWDDVAARGERALAQPIQFAYYRSQMTLEMDIARGLQSIADNSGEFAIHDETKLFIKWRSRHQLLRLRALLAVVCWRQGQPRWRRHWLAVTRALRKPALAGLLSRRDPDIGALFWQIGLVEGMDGVWAAARLAEIGRVEPILPLLGHDKAAVRAQAATLLANIGDERAIAALSTVQPQEAHTLTRRAIANAIQHLEALPPPRLRIQLMGAFALWRGPQPIPDTSWYRPVVLRLFLYFAVHAGRPLSKEKILDDLWPDSDPAKAATTFRTVYSRLRKLLEPHMRSKAPNRYVSLSGDTYTFDPDGRSLLDVRRFQQIVGDALHKRPASQVAAIPQSLVEALRTYAPLLPDHPYAEWLLEPRQRVEELYIEGCLLLARAYLGQGENSAAVDWARQTTSVAPWLEEAYQLLLRAYSRQGQRTLALHAYAAAVTNLKRELDLVPSPMTQQLAAALRAGKSI